MRQVENLHDPDQNVTVEPWGGVKDHCDDQCLVGVRGGELTVADAPALLPAVMQHSSRGRPRICCSLSQSLSAS